jgi:predicted porin
MNKKLIAVAVAAGLALPVVASHASDNMETKGPELYGKLHVNAGQYDSLTSTADKASIESFDSRLGFKGQVKLDDGLLGTYQIEGKIVLDGKTSNFADRTSFVGLKGGFGEVRVGYHDSPLKLAQGKFDQFGDTKGDFKNAGDQSGEHRNANSLTYLAKFGDIGFNAQIQPSEGTGVDGGGGQSFTDNTSIALTYNAGPLYLAVATDSYDKKLVAGSTENTLTRLVATYKLSDMQFGLLSQSGVAAATTNSNKETWLGMSFNVKMGSNNKLKAQIMTVKDNAATKLESTQTSIGIDHKAGKKGTLYAMYTKVKEKATVVTKDDSSVSVGYILKF